MALNRLKAKVLRAQGYGPEKNFQDKQSVRAEIRLTLADEGMQVVEVLVNTRNDRKHYIDQFIMREGTALVRALLPLEDGQASFQIPRLSSVSTMLILVRILPPKVTRQTGEELDKQVE